MKEKTIQTLLYSILGIFKLFNKIVKLFKKK